MTLTRCKLEPLLLLIAGNGPLMRDAWALFTHTHICGQLGQWVSREIGYPSLACLAYMYLFSHMNHTQWLAGSLQGKIKEGKKVLMLSHPLELLLYVLFEKHEILSQMRKVNWSVPSTQSKCFISILNLGYISIGNKNRESK